MVTSDAYISYGLVDLKSFLVNLNFESLPFFLYTNISKIKYI